MSYFICTFNILIEGHLRHYCYSIQVKKKKKKKKPRVRKDPVARSNASYGFKSHYLGLELARFTQLKRHTRYDDIDMLVWDQGLIFHIAAVSLPVH